MDCVALAAKLVANRPDTVTPKQGDLPQPLPLFYAQALEHRCEMMRDSEIPSFLETQIIPSVRVYKRCCFR